MKSLVKRIVPAIVLAGLLVSLHSIARGPERAPDTATPPPSRSSGEWGGPQWQREYFSRLHTPYPAVLPPEVHRRILDEVAAMPRQDPAELRSTWQLVGPSGMLIDGDALHSGRCLDIDAVTGSQTMVAAASGGLWRYELLFPVPIADELPSQWIGSFAIDPADEDVILVGTGEPYIYGGAGLYKTFDGGLTWHHRPMGAIPGEFFRIRYGPDGTTVHAATTSGYYRSPDGGETWQRTLTGDVTDLALHPTDPLVVYATLKDQGLFLSVDGGLNWGQATNAVIPTSDVTRGSVSVCASAPGTIYAAFAHLDGNDAEVMRGIYKTTNHGLSWIDISPDHDYMNGQGWYNNVIAVCPTDPDLVLAGGVEMLRSTNGGLSWEIMPHEPHLHGDHHAIQWHPNGLYVWVGHDGGWSYSPQQGAPGTWISNANSLPITQFVHMDLDGYDWNTAVIGGGSQDNGISISNDGGSTWWQSVGADGGGFNIVDGMPHIMYMAFGYFNTGLAFIPHLSINGGVDWFPILNGLPDSDVFYPALRLDGNNVPFIHYEHFVYRYDFGNNLWHQVGWPIPTLITEMTVSPQPDQRVIYVCALPAAGVPGQLWVMDQNDYFENRTNGLPSMREVRKVVPDPSDSHRAYALMAGLGNPTEQVYMTENRGLSWTNITGNLPYLTLVDMVVHPDDSQKLYLGSEFGYYRTLDGGATWESWHEGLPRAVVASEMRMVDMREQGGDLWVVSSTYGRSIWRRSATTEDPTASRPAAAPLLGDAVAAPNPFNPVTEISFDLGERVRVHGAVHDVAGRRIRDLVDADLPAGHRTLRWDGRDQAGRPVPAGVYVVRLDAAGQRTTLKITLVE